MPIIITSKQEGFRRCGLDHSTRATEYGDDRFTQAQLAQLRAEPMLLVVVKSAPAIKTERKAKTEVKAQAAEKHAASSKPAQAKSE